ncbi:MAG TPA: DNA-binding response regulator [Oceanospirillales bacterium]|nr:DNA-binding response regulator [Oceanospirillaceae bacterium]HBS42992.1 DNA-binding response regulator [Oceanospirillales bacterium]|tara:strand:+ start:790 stop:1437 length:648 start_codon:yes stop_codon:yes gene_type:complete
MYHFHIADDHPLFRTALVQVISQNYPDSSISQSQTLESTLHDLENLEDVDLLLLDLNMPGSMDLFGLVTIRETFPGIPVVIVSGNEEQATVNRALGHGALGYISKSLSPEQMSAAITAVLDGKIWVEERFKAALKPISAEEKDLAGKIASLTPQQYKVLCLLKEGWLNKQIGYEIGVTEATVKAHITAIFRKLNVSNRVQAILEMNKLAIHPDEA